MKILGATGTANPGSNTDKQRGYFTSVITAIKTVLTRLAAWLSVAAVIL